MVLFRGGNVDGVIAGPTLLLHSIKLPRGEQVQPAALERARIELAAAQSVAKIRTRRSCERLVDGIVVEPSLLPHTTIPLAEMQHPRLERARIELAAA